MTPTSTVACSKHYAGKITCAGGGSPVTITLSSLTDIEGMALDATSLRANFVRLVADEDNAGNVTFGPGTSDGYEIFGPAKSVDVPPGGFLGIYLAGGIGTVGADLGGSGSGGGSGSAAWTGTTLAVTGASGDVLTVEIGFGP
jgi:hypothetical protein